MGKFGIIHKFLIFQAIDYQITTIENPVLHGRGQNTAFFCYKYMRNQVLGTSV